VNADAAVLLDRDRLFVIAHRGGSRLAPENTLAAFDTAAGLGVDGFELDVHASREGRAVVIHDPTLERTTDAAGQVSQHTAAELAQVDAGYRFIRDGAFPFRGAGIGVPTLDEVLTRHPAMLVTVELKTEAAVGPALEAVRQAGAERRVLFGSFSFAALEAVRAHGFLTSASVPEVSSAVVRSRLWLGPSRRRRYQLLQVPEVKNGTRVVSPRFVRLARRAGLPVQVWIVDEPADVRRLREWGVTAFISDRPDLALEALGRRR
jgi:glycerophosphoryl diester phosphodiesterase